MMRNTDHRRTEVSKPSCVVAIKLSVELEISTNFDSVIQIAANSMVV